MSKTMSATEARIHFGELMRHVTEKQEPVIVERAGKPINCLDGGNLVGSGQFIKNFL